MIAASATPSLRASQIRGAIFANLIEALITLPPQKDGIDAALAIREQIDIPCLMVSAHRHAQLQARAAAARPRGWLMKPFSDQQLLTAIESALKPNQPG